MQFNRNDIIPSEFSYLLSYDLGGNGPEQLPFMVSEASGSMRVKPADNYEELYKCCVCGTHFRYGDVWVHEPSDTRICLGWRCAEKYGLMVSRDDFQGKRARAIRQALAKEKRNQTMFAVIRWLIDHPQARVWLTADHHITRDLKAKLFRWGSLTPKQLDLLKKLYLDSQRREEEEGEAVEIPDFEGRVEIECVLLGTKVQDGFYGSSQLKMLVKVPHGDGHFKLWGTMPDSISLVDEFDDEGVLLRQDVPQKGSRFKFTARIERSKDDPTFGFFKRPTKAEITEMVWRETV